MKSSQHSYCAAPPALMGPHIESWRLLWHELVADAVAMDEYRAWQTRRRKSRPQLLELLSRYLSGAIDTDGLRATFDRRTRTDWDAFGLKGMSGAMFLNKLVKHVPDMTGLAGQLRAVLPAPPDPRIAAERLREFIVFLETLAHDGHVAMGQLQPARAAFFVSMWWHMQDPEQWPGFHQSARRVMQAEDSLYVPTGDSVRDYVAFRDLFLALASRLGRTIWELEYLCWWHHEHEDRDADEPVENLRAVRTRLGARRPAGPRALSTTAGPALALVREARAAPPAGAPRAHEDRALRHTQVQWLLARLGRELGCRVWIAANDRHRVWHGQSLSAASIRALPSLGIDPDSQRIVRAIDVVWLQGTNEVAAAFEIERTTSVYSGLLRMADLTALSPNLNFPLYIVTPAERLEKVRRELARPTFQRLRLHRRCGFFSEEALLEAADSLARWASGPAAIKMLAAHADDMPLHEPHG